jgi:chromosome segregation ATPase
VAVSVTDATPSEAKTGDITGDVPSDATEVVAPFHVRALTALEDALKALREAKDGEIATLREGIAKADARAEASDARADRAEAAIARERARVDALRERLDATERQKREAQDAAELSQPQITDAESTVDELRTDRDQAPTEAQEALQTVEALRREGDGRKARVRCRRLLDALVGNVGRLYD